MISFILISGVLINFAFGGLPPENVAFCSTTGTNIRDDACGTVIDSAATGECFRTREGRQTCSLSGTSYNFWELSNNGGSGWVASEYLRPAGGTDKAAGAVPGSSIEPAAEFRAAFVATVNNIDWPTSCNVGGMTAHQTQMSAYLDALQDANMNAIMLQVRTSGDAFYNSPIEPWSRYLTCTQGAAPSPYWDPLEWTIAEAHSRGIEIHAWLNPYRANLSPSFSGLAANHPCMSNLAEFCYTYDNYLWMDPGAPVVVEQLVSVVSDILERYNVDGIHFDDYFYPYPSAQPFPDDSTFAQYGNGMARDDWRRDNVNKMVARVSQTVKTMKPEAKFSISPFGIYRPGEVEGMPSPIVGFDPYAEIFADAKAWLEAGALDFIAPQIYWGINPPAQSYYLIFDWWTSKEANPLGIPVLGATSLYKVPDNGWPAEEISMQPCETLKQLTNASSGIKMHFNHGTTTLGFKYKGGILVAVDSRATGGAYIGSRTVEKIIVINEYMVGTMAGGAADCTYWERVLSRQCRLYELRNKDRISVAAASKLLANMLYNYKGMGLSLGVMIAGYDKRGPSLFYVDNDGTRTSGDVFSVGSGSLYAYGVLDSGYSYDLSDEEAISLGQRAIYHAAHRDGSSGGFIRVVHINQDGVKLISVEDSNDIHWKMVEAGKGGINADSIHTI